ncbi:hypothetical protein ACIRCZ_04965 [Leifsonia sp. NPDC102414]|uniref:hypothetical protein n=1 Tax=Leifsonia sp. NPDC102414 TaxID=3364124 RepID=UPI0038148245
MTALLPRLFRPDVLPLAELMALCLDGQLYRVGDSFATLDTPDSAALRAAAFASSAPSHVIADRGTAAWIHGARAAPSHRPQVCVDARSRGGRIPPEFDGRQTTLSRGDVQLIDEARVTSPARTALDLLCVDGRFSPDAAAQVLYLLDRAGVPVSSIKSRMRGSSRTNARRYLARADQLSARARSVLRPFSGPTRSRR